VPDLDDGVAGGKFGFEEGPQPRGHPRDLGGGGGIHGMVG
jgi:hypothetical protein